METGCSLEQDCEKDTRECTGEGSVLGLSFALPKLRFILSQKTNVFKNFLERQKCSNRKVISSSPNIPC